MPQRRNPADNEHKQRTCQIENEIIHIARAGAGVDLQHLHCRDAQRERRREEENASLLNMLRDLECSTEDTKDAISEFIRILEEV